MTGRPEFAAGRNVAMRLPLRHFDETLAFYRDILGLPVEERSEGATVTFGPMRLHLDRLPLQSQTDIWLEIVSPDTPAARAWLSAQGVGFCPEVEALPEGYDGFWISSPSSTIHIVNAPERHTD